MEKIVIIVERANDGTYSAYIENVAGGYGMGDTPKQAVIEAMEGLELTMEGRK
ncbi:hypothetical protein D9M68_608240 [compost metagenome]